MQKPDVQLLHDVHVIVDLRKGDIVAAELAERMAEKGVRFAPISDAKARKVAVA